MPTPEPPPQEPPPRDALPSDATLLVLDTNTVMALWLFEDPALARLRAVIETGPVPLATRADALEELRRVLAYRQFAVEPSRQRTLFETYAARCRTITTDPRIEPPLPQCRDADDQKFLEIARDAGATHLVSRDKALLRLGRHRLIRPLYAILTPEALAAEALDERRSSAR